MDQMELLAQHRELLQAFDILEANSLSVDKALASKRHTGLLDSEQQARAARDKAENIISSARSCRDDAQQKVRTVVPNFIFQYPQQIPHEQFQVAMPRQALELAERNVQEHARNLRNAVARYLQEVAVEDFRRRQAVGPGRFRLSVVVNIIAFVLLILLSNGFASITSQNAFGVFLVMVAVLLYIIAGVFLIRSENRTELGPFQNYTRAAGGFMFFGWILYAAPCIGPLIVLPLLYLWFVGLRVIYGRYMAWLDGADTL